MIEIKIDTKNSIFYNLNDANILLFTYFATKRKKVALQKDNPGIIKGEI
jgi:hypothetical protein